MRSSGSVLTGDYLKIVREISDNIRASRYLAARSVNRESLLLYFRTGKILSVRIAASDWGDAALAVISQGVQKNFPGIRGFSIRNLYNMRQFFDAYSSSEFLQLLTAKSSRNEFLQLVTAESKNNIKSQSATGQTEGDPVGRSTTAHIHSNKRRRIEKVFFQIGFTHHILLLQLSMSEFDNYRKKRWAE